MSITKRTLKDGSTVYDVREYIGFNRNGEPDRQSITCRTMAEAKTEQAKLRAIREAMNKKSGKITFGAYVDYVFWPSCDGLEASSRATYEKELRLRLMPAFEKTELRNIDRNAIQAMLDRCATKSVARKALGLLKTILSDAMGDCYISVNPAKARYSMPGPGKKRDSGMIITSFEDMAPLLQAVEDYGEDSIMKLAFLGLLMGLRPEERYGLDDEDVDDRQKNIYIHQAYTASSKLEGGNNLKGTKTKKGTRSLSMTAPFIDRLPLLERSPGAFIKGKTQPRISPSTAQHRWRAFLAWCDKHEYHIEHITLENMRHSFATSYLRAGGHIADLSPFLGHEDINTTYNRYVRSSQMDVLRGSSIVPRI